MVTMMIIVTARIPVVTNDLGASLHSCQACRSFPDTAYRRRGVETFSEKSSPSSSIRGRCKYDLWCVGDSTNGTMVFLSTYYCLVGGGACLLILAMLTLKMANSS